MAPGSYINIYYKSLNDKGEVMFGKFISNIKILDVKDSSGQHVFENRKEARKPKYILIAVHEETKQIRSIIPKWKSAGSERV